MDPIFDIIMDWVIMPVLDFFCRRQYSGRWHFSHLLPVAIVAFLCIWWLGEHWDSILLTVIGALGAFFSGVINLIIFIPRRRGERDDLRSYFARRKREAEEAEKKNAD